MDIAGAKALKKRLGSKGTEDAPPSSADVREDAPPVYRWLGVSQPARETRLDDDEDGLAAGASFFERLGLSFR